MKLTALVAVFVMSTLGCASTYRPQERGRISFVLSPGIALHKDGTSYSAGGLSSDPIRAVAGNQAAEEHARTYVRRSRLFWSIYALAVGCLATSVIASSRYSGHDDRRNVAIGFGVAGFTALAASLIPGISAPGHPV